jgi:hypothetical protein
MCRKNALVTFLMFAPAVSQTSKSNNSAKSKRNYKNILGYESGAQLGSIHEKNQR